MKFSVCNQIFTEALTTFWKSISPHEYIVASWITDVPHIPQSRKLLHQFKVFKLAFLWKGVIDSWILFDDDVQWIYVWADTQGTQPALFFVNAWGGTPRTSSQTYQFLYIVGKVPRSFMCLRIRFTREHTLSQGNT